MSAASNKRPAYSPDFIPPNIVGAAHPSQGVQPWSPHVTPTYVATEINELTEAGPGTPGIRSSLAMAGKTQPRRSGDAFEGAASGGASNGKWQQDDRDAMASSAGRHRESVLLTFFVYL
jgi:hypothetical protein